MLATLCISCISDCDLLFSHHFHASVHCTCICKSTITFFNLLIIININITQKCDMDAEYIRGGVAQMFQVQNGWIYSMYLAAKFAPETVVIILWSGTGHMENSVSTFGIL